MEEERLGLCWFWPELLIKPSFQLLVQSLVITGQLLTDWRQSLANKMPQMKYSQAR